MTTVLVSPVSAPGSPPGARDFASARDLLAALARAFDGPALDGAEAAVIAAHLAGIRNIASTLLGLAARRVAETGVWRSSAASAESWLASVAGATGYQAREALLTARRLSSLPDVEAAARSGELSPGQAVAVADAVAAAPSRAAELLSAAAEEPLGVLREQCLAVKAAADPDPMATWRRQRASRVMVRRTDSDGMATLFWRTTVDERARFDAVIDPIIDSLSTVARRQGRAEPREAYASDAMAELARRAADPTMSDAGPAGDGLAMAGMASVAEPAGRRRSTERFLTLVRVDLSALRRGKVEPGEVCEIPGVGPIPVPVAREVLGESVLKLVITRGVDVTTTCSLGRGPTAAMRIAKTWEQPLCVVAGCPNRAGLEYDHDMPVAAGGPTAAWNFNRPCARHHYLKTHHGWDLVPGHGRRAMVPPKHPDHPRHAQGRAFARAGPGA